MKIEIVICTYNRAERLSGTIQSLLSADIPDGTNVNLIIVNNNSSDGTEALIKEFSRNASRVAFRYLFEEKQGKSYALNTALKHMRGNFIAFTDDDIIVDKSWIKKMVSALKRYPDCNCFGGKVVAVYPKNMPPWLDIHNSTRFLKSVFVDRDDGDLEVEYGNSTLSNTPSGVNMFFRREVIEKNAFFRTDLGPIGKELGFSEDTDYCQRLLNMGERFMYIPSTIVYHPVHAERLSKEYLLNWQYKCGISEVRRNGGYKDTVRIFGVPRYLYRKYLKHAVGSSLLFSSVGRFRHKLRRYYTAGEIVEHLSIESKST